MQICDANGQVKVIGLSGFSGWSGVSGGSGLSGLSGLSGQSGASGLSGTSGLSSASGLSGFTGQSGFSGRPGADIYYSFTTAGGPSAGQLYFSHSGGSLTFASAMGVSLNSSTTDAFGGNVTTFISEVQPGDYVRLFSLADASVFVIYKVSAVFGFTGYQQIEVQDGPQAYGGTMFSPNETIGFIWVQAGAQGDSGYSGASGALGFSGYSGISGLSGTSGGSGSSGQSGASGVSALSGQSGWSGTSGQSGWSGVSAWSGQSGWSGTSGQSGWSGTSAWSGQSGWSGTSGQSGSSGTSGQSGWSGTSGYTGTSGISAYSGTIGVSGFSAYSGYSAAAGNTNFLINPQGDFFQRQFTASTLTTQSNNTYGPDRWKILTQTASVQSAQVAGNTTAQANQFAMRIKQNQASAQRFGWIQWMESSEAIALRGQTITLNFQCNYSNNAAIRYAILEWTGTADSPVTDVVNDWTSSTYTTGNFFKSTTMTVTGTGTTTPGAATWTNMTLANLTVGNSCNNLAVMVWVSGTAAQNSTLDVTACQLTQTTTAPTYAPPIKAADLSNCNRYCLACWCGTAVLGFGQVAGTNSIQWIYYAPSLMRVTPTLTASSSTGFNGNDTTNNVQCNGIFIDSSINGTSFRMEITQAGTTWTTGRCAAIFGHSASDGFYLDADF